MKFRNKRETRTSAGFKIGDSEIDLVDGYRYLGIFFDEILTFDICAKTLSEAAGRALGSIISKFKQFKNVGYHIITKLYDTGVSSILSYGASIWGFGKDKYGQQIQNTATRYFLCVHKKAPIHALQADMGWVNVKYHFYLCAVQFWNRLLQMNNERLTKKVAEYQLIYINDCNWVGKSYNILDKIGKTDKLIESKELNLTDTENDFLDLMHEEWSNNVGFKPKLRNYIKYKQNINAERYVTCNITRSQRSLLAQLRMGILPLHIETGRYFRKPLVERLCLLCDQNLVEDVYHFLCQCPLYQVERRTLCNYIPNFESLVPNEQFIKLMTCETKFLAKYVENCWSKRKDF